MEQPVIRDWQKDFVYLIQFPRAGSIPSVSPFCLKLETWLRMTNIPYQNVDNQFKFKSKRGQVPFVELNGRQIADTNFIISELSRIFGIDLDEHLNEQEKSLLCAFHSLIEESLAWACLYYRSGNMSSLASEDGVIKHFNGFKKFMFRTFAVPMLQRSTKKRCFYHGIGKNSPEEVSTMTKRNLKAVSVFLDDKRYMMGDHPTSLDATAFGHLCMFCYGPPFNRDIRNFIESDCRNILDYLRNMKDDFWPDWNEAISKLSLATKPYNISTIEPFTGRQKQVITPVVHPDEPNPEATNREGSIEVFDIEDSHSHE